MFSFLNVFFFIFWRQYYELREIDKKNPIFDMPLNAKGLQYILSNMHTVFALLCFVVVIHWLIIPYPSGLLHWHCGNLTIAPVPAKQPWWIWINTSCEFIMNDCITTTKQSTTKPCAYFLGYTVYCGWAIVYNHSLFEYVASVLRTGAACVCVYMSVN